MDAKLTLSFDASVIESAKKFAEKQGISLSRLIEVMLRKATAKNYKTLEDLPISDWVQQVSEGNIEYVTKHRHRKDLKSDFFEKKK